MRARLAPGAVLAAALAYFLAFRHYGFQVEDEGTLLFQLARAAAGERPYLDFHTGYTPGYFAAGAFAFGTLGLSATGVRAVLALVNALSAATLYALARRFVGPWMAALPALLWVAFLPVFPSEFASFAVPYPAWLATLAWLAMALAIVTWAERGGGAALAGAGVAAGLAFAVKPNAGAFALAAAVWSASIFARRTSPLDRAAGALGCVAMALGVWMAFGFTWWSVDAAVHLAPVAVIAALAAGPLAGSGAGPAHGRTVAALATLGAAFAAVTLVWLAPVALRLGLAGTLRDVFLIGSGAAELYYTPHPPPELYALAVTAAALGFALAGRLTRDGRVSPVAIVALAAIAVAALGLRLASSAVMPESPASSLVWQLENAAFWLAPLAHWGGIALLARGGSAGAAPPRAPLVLVPLAVAMYLQLYPRADFMHLATAVPVTLVLASVLLDRVLRWWAAARWPAGVPGSRLVHALLAGAVVVLVAVKIGPALHALAWSAAPEAAAVATATLDVRIERGADDDFTAFGKTADFLAAHTERGEPALAFPALTGVLFAARLTSPVPHDYWYPGRPDHADEAAMLATLEHAPPRFAVTLNDGWTFFSESPQYFLAVRDFVLRHYRLVARFGRYDVLARRDVTADAPVLRWQPTGPATAALEPRLAYRRQAARRWMAGLTVEEATHAALDAAPRDALLRLRALRDGGDLRAAGWLIAGYDHPSARVKNEAVSAMHEVTKRFHAARYRWADDLDLGAYRRYVAPYVADARRLAGDASPRVRAFGAALAELIEPADHGT